MAPRDDRPDVTLSLYVSNLDCESDSARLLRGMNGRPGVTHVDVYPKSARVRINLDPDRTTVEAIRDALSTLGFPVREARAPGGPPIWWRNAKVMSSLASGVFFLVGWLLEWSGGAPGIAIGLYVTSLIVGAYYFGREALDDLLFERSVGIELLMTVAAVVASLLGAVGEGAMLAFLYSISEAAEGYTEEKTRSAVKALMDLTPKTAVVMRDGVGLEIPAEEIEVGDVFLVKPGESLATDGEVIAGHSNVNQAPVTGESVPVEKNIGDSVFAGSINGEGTLDVRATKVFAENTIARIVHMVEEAQERKGNSQRFIERFGARYSPAVLLAGLLLGVAPPLLFGAAWHVWLVRATVFIVAAAPCALAISIPVTLVATLGTGARRGVLIKGGVYIEELAKVRVVALDKTGTITRGMPEVTDVISMNAPGVSSEDAVSAAAAIERRSQHPLGQAIVRYAERQSAPPMDAAGFRSLTGAGASATVNGKAVYVGSPRLFERELGIALSSATDEISRLQSEGKTIVVVGGEHAAWAIVAIRDMVRPNAAAAVRALREAGIRKVVMLTGDNTRTADAIARHVGIDEVRADLKPEDKAAIVRELGATYAHVAMVGDGVNDAPALAEATVGIAMGAAGTDVALETADVALMADDLEKLVYAIRLARRSEGVVRQNLVLSVAVVTVLIAGAVLGTFTLPGAVIAHELSEFVVIANGLRMVRA